MPLLQPLKKIFEYGHFKFLKTEYNPRLCKTLTLIYKCYKHAIREREGESEWGSRSDLCRPIGALLAHCREGLLSHSSAAAFPILALDSAQASHPA